MNAKKSLGFFYGILIILLLLTAIALFRSHNSVPVKIGQTLIEQEIQSDAHKQDVKNLWIREHLAGSVVTIES
jgi:hypothetical protein